LGSRGYRSGFSLTVMGFVGMVTQQATATVDAAEPGLQDNTAWESASAHVVMPGPGFQNNGGETEHSDVADQATYEAAERLAHRYGFRFVKRLFDVAFSLLVLALFWWLYLIVAIAIFADDHGPVFFRQERVGKDGRHFRMWKFRSMYVDAEDRLSELKDLNEKDGPVFKIKDDPRVTRVGHFIRKTSLDELPQFFNVIKGDMSIVGPRPAIPRETKLYNERQRQRLLVKPGITCYWQTRRNRDAISFDEWVDLDLMYIKQCSAWADFKLIIQTVGVVLTAQGN
jgi:exopolysaccharide biosynthesis polyprenyl glycosylphosphotransferase